MSESAIQLENVKKKYGTFEVLKGVNLNIYENEFVTLERRLFSK